MKISINDFIATGACQATLQDGTLVIDFTSEGKVAFSHFSTLQDTVSVKLSYVCNGDAIFSTVGIKPDKSTEIFRSDKLTGDSLEYTYDPINLSVYRDMHSFYTEIYASTPCRVELKQLQITDEVALEVSATATSVTSAKHDAPKKMLFMGNSLLLGIEMQYGMCASAKDKDYFHYVSEYVRSKSPDCVFNKVHSSDFEHSETLQMFEDVYYNLPNKYTGKPLCESFTEDLDLIILQFGDNINTDEKNATFAVSGDLFMERVRAASPKARIIWVHGWYNREPTYSYIVRLCEKWGAERMEIGDLRDRAAEAHTQPTYTNKEGIPMPVKDTWRTHPGDVGMKRIGEKLISFLNLK